MLTLIFLSVLIMLSTYRFKKIFTKRQKYVINFAAIIMILVPIYKLFIPSTTDKSQEQIFTGIAENIQHRHSSKDKILCVYHTREQKNYLNDFIKKIDAKSVDEIIMNDLCAIATPKLISEAIQKKGGHYDNLILTFTANELKGPLEIDPSQFDYAVIFTSIYPSGMEDWFERHKCVIYKISPQTPDENNNAFETMVRCFDHNNYADWKEGIEIL